MLTVRTCDPKDFPIQDNLFQTAFWGTFKTAQGQKALFFFVEDSTVPVQFPFVVLLRKTAGGSMYAYAPKAPALSVREDKQGLFLEELALAVQRFLPATCTCIRFDLPWERTADSATLRPELRNLRMNYGTQTTRLRKSPLDYLCPDTVIIDLKYAPEQLLAKLRQTTRNSVRRAYKSDIVFSRYSTEEALAGTSPLLREWHAVYEETAIRKRFYYEKYDYFHELFLLSERQDQFFRESTNASFSMSTLRRNGAAIPPTTAIVQPPSFYLFTARKDGTMLSGLILACCGHTAYYLYAGSNIEGREFMPNYGLQWEAMLFARRSGCTKYDLLGISPTANTAHPMYGLYLFKTGFGGETKHFAGAWDYVYDKDDYAVFITEEQFSVSLHS